MASSDLVAVLPARFVRVTKARVTIHPLPFEHEPIALHLMWHPRWTSDARHRWIRDGIVAACR